MTETDADGGFSVLLVEDDADTARLMVRYLEAHGLRVARAADGRQAWRMFQDAPPDVLLTDLMLPWMGAAELIRHVRGHPRGAHVPVVVATASVTGEERAEALRQTLGAEAVLPKPVPLRLMLSTLLRCRDDARMRPRAASGRTLPPVAADHAVLLAHPAMTTPPMGVLATTAEADSAVERTENALLPLCHTLLRLRHHHVSALMVVRDSRGTWQLVVEEGVIVGAACSDPALGLPATLLEDCALTPEQTARASALMGQGRRTFPSAAAEVMGVEPWVVAAAMERHVRRVAWRALSATDGNHVVLPWRDDTFLLSEFSLDPQDVVQDLALGPLPERAVDAALEVLSVLPTPPLHVVESRLRRLGERLARMGHVPAVRWPQNASAVWPWIHELSEEQRRQVLALLLSSQLDDALPMEAALRDVVPGTRGGTTVGLDWVGEETNPDEAEARNCIAQWLIDSGGRDAYALLGVARTVTAAEAAEAAARWAEAHGPRVFAGVDLGPAEAALRRLSGRVRAAADLLADPVARRRYDALLQRDLGGWSSAGPASRGVPPPPPPQGDGSDELKIDSSDLVLEAPDAPPAPPPATSLGDHALESRLAVGGAAEVFLAARRATGERVVLKRLRPDRELDLPAVTGFIRECDLATRLHHPHVVQGMERGLHRGLPYLVMEWVDGMDLERALVLAQRGRVEVERGTWTYIVECMLEGLAHLHAVTDDAGRLLGAVHRDLAPRNVLLSRAGDVKLADFGACVFTATELPPTEVVGSAGYLSPEQARLELLDARSDVFAAGCILHRVVTGEPAFDLDGRPDAEVLDQHREGVTRTLPAHVPAELARVVEAATSRAREDRYASAADLARALRGLRRSLGEKQGQADVAALVARLQA